MPSDGLLSWRGSAQPHKEERQAIIAITQKVHLLDHPCHLSPPQSINHLQGSQAKQYNN